MCIFQTASRRHLLCCVLFAILFTACPQPVGATPTRYSVSHTRSLMQQKSSLENYAGYFAHGKQGTFTQAGMFFTVPTLTLTKGINTQVSTWVGVDGAAGTELVQVGVESDISSYGDQVDYAWWEIVGQPINIPATHMKLTVNPGDSIQAYVSSNPKDGFDYFSLQDMTTGDPPEKVSKPLPYSDGTRAECLVENPNGGVAANLILANFGTITIIACAAGPGSKSQGGEGIAPIGSFPNDQTDMVDNGVTLASTGSLTAGATFDVHYCPNGKCP